MTDLTTSPNPLQPGDGWYLEQLQHTRHTLEQRLTTTQAVTTTGHDTAELLADVVGAGSPLLEHVRHTADPRHVRGVLEDARSVLSRHAPRRETTAVFADHEDCEVCEGGGHQDALVCSSCGDAFEELWTPVEWPCADARAVLARYAPASS